MPPMHQLCPMCGHDDAEYLSCQINGPGSWTYLCTDPAHAEPFSWDADGTDVLKTGG